MTILSWLDPGTGALRLAALVMVQITAVIGLAWGLATLLARKSAALRDAIWLVALGGVVLGPVVLIALDRVGLTFGLVPVSTTASEPTRTLENPARSPLPRQMDQTERTAATPAMIIEHSTSRPSPTTTFRTDGTWPTWREAARVALQIWWIGAILGLLWLAYGLWAVAALRLGSRPVSDPRAEAMLAEIARSLGLRIAPSLLTTNRLTGPVAVGLVRPAILMPKALLETEDDDRLRDILIHESAHLLRRDPLAGLVQRLAVAAFWPHPLIHLLSRSLTRAREETCDNYVLRAGDRIRYARTLLDLTESFRMAPRALMAAGLLPLRWRLADRVAGLLDERRNLMIHVHRRTLSGLAALMLLTVAPFAVLGTERTQAQTEAAKSAPSAKEAPPAPDDGPVTAQEIAGIVVDSKGHPLEGVTADAYSWAPGQVTKTDARGRFRLRSFDRPWNASMGGAQMRLTKEGYGPKTLVEVKGGTANLRVVLDDSTLFEGTVTAPDGSPVPEATVRANNPMLHHNGREFGRVWTETRTNEYGRYRLLVEPSVFDISVRVPGVGVARISGKQIESGQAVKLDISLKEGTDFRAKVVDSLTGKPVEGLRLYRWLRLDDVDIEGTSGPDGLITIDDLPPGPIKFDVEGLGYARWWSEQAISEWNRKTIGKGNPRYGPWQRNFDYLDFDLSPGMKPVTIIAEKGVTVRGRVLDPAGKPVSGATVAGAHSGSGNSLTGDTRFSVETDKDGTYELLLPASGACEYNLIAHDGDYREWRTWANGVTEPFRTKPGEVLENVDLRLTRPATVRGRVVDAEGHPVADRDVRAGAADMLGNRYYDPTTRTDDEGHFELKFISPGKQYIQVAPFWLFADQAPAGTSRTVTLELGQVVEGIELTAQPQP